MVLLARYRDKKKPYIWHIIYLFNNFNETGSAVTAWLSNKKTSKLSHLLFWFITVTSKLSVFYKINPI